MTRLHRALGSCVFGVAVAFQPVAAQSPRATPSALLESMTHLSAAADRVDPPAKGGSVFTRGEPRSFQVVRIPVPSELHAAEIVSYDIRAESQFRLLGQVSGQLLGTAVQGGVLVTLGVPATALAGELVAARVTFRAADRIVEVPIAMEVLPIYSILLTAEPQLDDLYPSERAHLRVSVRNAGNVADTVRLTHVLPAEWRVQVRDTTLVLAAQSEVTRAVRFAIPRGSGTGAFFLRTSAISRRDSAAVLTTLAVATNRAGSVPPGASIRTSIGSVAVQNDHARSIAQISILGPLASSMNIDAAFSTAPSLDAPAARGLGRVGAYATSPRLAAWSDTWRIDIGQTLVNVGDLTGVNAAGRGITFGYDDRRTRFGVHAVQPGIGEQRISPDNAILGFSAGHTIGGARVDASAARMRDPGLAPRNMSAAGLQLVASVEGVELLGGLAYREFGGQTGVGWLAGMDRSAGNTRGSLRIVHAPGGTGAFARAEDEIAGTLSRRVTARYEIGAGYTRSADARAANNGLSSQSFSFGQQFRLSGTAVVRTDLRTSTYDVSGEPFSFGHAERHVGGGTTVQAGGTSLTADVGYTRVTRAVEVDALSVARTGGTLGWRGSAQRSLSYGEVTLHTTYDRALGADRFLPEQATATLAARRVQAPSLPRNLFVDLEAGINHRTGTGTALITRAGATYSLTSAMEVRLSAERNPLYYGATSAAPWIVAMRVDRTIGLPRLNTNPAAGIVFEDHDGDGERDGDEPGVADVVIRRGRESAVSGKDGRFRFWQSGSGSMSIDATTLPHGWIASDRTASNDIALTPTTRLEIILEPGAAERLRNIDLSKAVVIARDLKGREWIARRTGANTAAFDVLPIGAYEIDVDFAGADEPLNIDGARPRITVRRDGTPPLTVRVSGRPLRFTPQPPVKNR